ncbi:MAG: hypothetical protein PVF15_04555 [Candidatus Bathyarchaeota archaeon]|jgi:uncharacterized membrane protein
MRSSTLIFILSIAFAFSVLGLFFFGFSGSFNGRGRGMSVEIPRSFWLVLFGVPLVVAVTALGYVLLFPELGEERLKEEIPSVPAGEKEESALNAILRVLNEDERKVIETLVAGGGTMLQKDIRWKTGLSRVKTHRILFRLGKRGIVTAEKYYNTNKIALADWLTKERKKP